MEKKREAKNIFRIFKENHFVQPEKIFLYVNKDNDF